MDQMVRCLDLGKLVRNWRIPLFVVPLVVDLGRWRLVESDASRRGYERSRSPREREPANIVRAAPSAMVMSDMAVSAKRRVGPGNRFSRSHETVASFSYS